MNNLFYHSCCDVWTTRDAKPKRVAHKNHLAWRKLALTFDKTIEDRKQALLAKMTEEGWRINVVLNECCSALSSSISKQQTDLRLHQPGIHPQDLQADLSSLDLIYQDQLPSELITSSGDHCFT